MNEERNGGLMLAGSGIAALLASACCIGPLVLVSIGLGGAWLSNLQALEPYRPVFIGVALSALALAYRRVFRPAAACAPGDLCAVPRVRIAYRIIFWLVAALIAVAFGFPYFAPLFY